MKWLVMLSLLLFVFGCASNVPSGSPSDVCVQYCKDALSSGLDLSNGPCLMNPMDNNPDWVCDVVRIPRQPVDNLPGNQCSAYSSGVSKHFVEVSTDCGLVRSV